MMSIESFTQRWMFQRQRFVQRVGHKEGLPTEMTDRSTNPLVRLAANR